VPNFIKFGQHLLITKSGTGTFLLNFMSGVAKKVGGFGWFLVVSAHSTF